LASEDLPGILKETFRTITLGIKEKEVDQNQDPGFFQSYFPEMIIHSFGHQKKQFP